MIDWWTTQDPALTLLQTLTTEQSPANYVGAVLAVQGRYLENEKLSGEKQDGLNRIFHSMLDVVDKGLAVQMYPDFTPSLLWLTSDARAMCALLPLNGLPSESEQVRLVAKAFYRFATGIEVGAKDGEIPPLLRWSKFAGGELSRIIDRVPFTEQSPRLYRDTAGAQ